MERALVAETAEKKQNNITTPKKNKRRKKLYIFLGIAVFLIIVRLIMPYFILRYVNNKLATIKEYYGHVGDINLALIRGAYVIKDINIVKKGNQQGEKDTIPFFRSPRIDLSIEWSALLKGAVVGEIIAEDPVLNFVKGKHKGEDVKADTADFNRVIDDLMPVTVNRFEINNGQIHYIDQTKNPKIDVAMTDVHILAENISSVNKENKVLPAHATASGYTYGGNFKLNIDFDPLQKSPTFDMNAELTHMNLVELNDFLRAYANVDVKRGDFGLYTEFSAKNAEFGGYVKPILKDLDIVQWNKEEGNIAQILWETLIGAAAKVLENRNKEQVATKVDIKGKLEDPNVNIWRSVGYLLQNAFVHALKPSIDNTINIGKMDDAKDKTLLERTFGGAKADRKKAREDRKKERREKKEKKKRKEEK
jgi:hypothetical protein